MNKQINDLLNYGTVLMTFTRPTLGANGTLGGSSFAVTANGQGYGPAWQAFDGIYNNDGSQWANSAGTGDYYIFYNPKGLKIASLGFYFQAQGMTAGTIYGSNDNSSYTQLSTFSGLNVSRGVLNTVTVNSTGFYKYHKILCTGYVGRCSIGELTFPSAVYIL